MTTIPRADVQAILARQGWEFALESDPTVTAVRQMVRSFIGDAGHADNNGVEQQRYLAMADDLEALADRYEQEAGT
jgi:hypothetical protein